MLPVGRKSFGFVNRVEAGQFHVARGINTASVNSTRRKGSELERNLALAEIVIKEVRSYLTVGTNTEKDCGDGDFLTFNTLAGKIRTDREHLERLYVECYQRPVDIETLANWIIDDLRMYGYGQCGELALAVFLILKNSGVQPLLHCVTSIGMHDVVVIGEKENAVVCDAWAEKVYPLSQFEEMQRPENDVRYARFIYKFQDIPPYLAGNLKVQYQYSAETGMVNFIDKLMQGAS